MNSKSEYADKDKQAPTRAGTAPACIITLRAPELAAILCLCGLLPHQTQQGRNWDDGVRK